MGITNLFSPFKKIKSKAINSYSHYKRIQKNSLKKRNTKINKSSKAEIKKRRKKFHGPHGLSSLVGRYRKKTIRVPHAKRHIISEALQILRKSQKRKVNQYL